MSRQTINGHLTDELTTQTVDAQHDRRDILAQLQDAPSRSAAERPAPAPQPAPSWAERPRGHVVGHAIGEPPAWSFAGRPRGHVVGHAGPTAVPRPTRTTYRSAA